MMKKIPLPPTTLILSFLLSFIISLYYPIYRFTPQYTLGAILIFLSLIIISISILKFKKNKTSIDPNDIPDTLIVSFPYSISRNPIYLSMLILLFGIDMMFRNIIMFINLIIFFIIINIFVIPKEEINIEKKFGNKFIDYKRKIRRWI
jgi:protein-S-isoprenylcysteine O-methyltransferase Ste14